MDQNNTDYVKEIRKLQKHISEVFRNSSENLIYYQISLRLCADELGYLNEKNTFILTPHDAPISPDNNYTIYYIPEGKNITIPHEDNCYICYTWEEVLQISEFILANPILYSTNISTEYSNNCIELTPDIDSFVDNNYETIVDKYSLLDDYNLE